MSKIKTKVLLNLSKRQLICFGAAAAIGIPVFLLTKGILGNSAAVIVMILVMLPAFFMAMYEKDGQPAEKILRNIVRSRWFFPRKRPYKTANFYQINEKESNIIASQKQKTTTARKTPAKKHPVR
jgi:hypothetical protein